MALLATTAASSALGDAKRACIAAATAGQRARDEGKLLTAEKELHACAENVCPAVIRQDCAQWASEVTAAIPRLTLGARDSRGADLAAVRVVVDGRVIGERLDGRPLPLDPGPHHIRLEAEGGLSADTDVVLRAGEGTRNVVLTLAPAQPTPEAPKPQTPTPAPKPLPKEVVLPPSPHPNVTALWVFGGLAVASAAVTTGLVIHAHGARDDLEGQCAPRCTDADTESVHTELALANIGVGVGAASLAALLYFALFHRTVTPRGAALATAVSTTGRPLGATLSF